MQPTLVQNPTNLRQRSLQKGKHLNFLQHIAAWLVHWLFDVENLQRKRMLDLGMSTWVLVQHLIESALQTPHELISGRVRTENCNCEINFSISVTTRIFRSRLHSSTMIKWGSSQKRLNKVFLFELFRYSTD